MRCSNKPPQQSTPEKNCFGAAGKAHYLDLSTKNVTIFGGTVENLPAWFRGRDWGVTDAYYPSSFLPSDRPLDVQSRAARRCVMPVIIPDEVLKQAGLTEKEALIEIACGLFDADKLHLWPAARLAGMSRGEFESALISRGIAVHRIDEEYLKHELEMSVRSRDSRVDDEHRRQ